MRLEEIYEEICNAKSIADLTKLKNELRLEILSQDLPQTTTKQRNTYCVKFMDKLFTKGSRPILGTCNYTDDECNDKCQEITNSYFYVKLCKEDFVIGVRDWKGIEHIGSFPNLSSVLPKTYEHSIDVCSEKLLKKAKLEEYVCIKNSEFEMYISSELLKTFFKFLNVDNSEIITFKFNVGKDKICRNAIRVEREYTNSYGLICPINKPENQKNNTEGE